MLAHSTAETRNPKGTRRDYAERTAVKVAPGRQDGSVPTSKLLVAAVFGILVAGCVNVRVETRTFGVASIDELQAEVAYNNIYSLQMSRLSEQLNLFAASGSNPGVCNVGGSLQGCHDADAKVIAAMQDVIAALGAVVVPPRFVAADEHFRAALAENIHGLALRSQAIENNDNNAWAQHKVVLEAAQASLLQAYQEFPADNRPLPAP